MINPFINEEELRLRAGWRILVFIFLYFLLLGFSALIPNTVFDYTYRALIVTALVIIVVRFLDKRTASDAGFQINKKWFKEIGVGFLIGFIAVSVIFLLEWSTGLLYIIGFEWERVQPNYLAVGYFLFQMMIVGYYEEAAFRGLLLKNITEGFQDDYTTARKAVVTAVLFSSILFGLAHAGNPNVTVVGVVNIMVAGIMLAIPYVITGSLALSIGIHAAWNFALGGVFGFNVSGLVVRNSLILINQDGGEIWTGGAFGPEAGIMGIIGMLVIIGLLFVYRIMKKEPITLHPSFTQTYLQKVKSLQDADELSE